VFTGFWLEGSKIRDHWEDLDIGGRIILKCNLGGWELIGRTRCYWLSIGSSGELL